MPWQPFKIDSSFENFGGRARPYVKQGYYLLEVTGIELSPEDHDGDSYWRWLPRIVQGPDGLGRVFPHIGTWKTEKQFGNGRMVANISPDLHKRLLQLMANVTTYQMHAAITQKTSDALKGQLFGAYIADGEPYNNRPQSEIKETFSKAEYDERVKHLPPPQATQVQPGMNPETASPNGPGPGTAPTNATQNEQLQEELQRLMADIKV